MSTTKAELTGPIGAGSSELLGIVFITSHLRPQDGNSKKYATANKCPKHKVKKKKTRHGFLNREAKYVLQHPF